MDLTFADVLQLHTVRYVAKVLAHRWGLGLGFVGGGAAHPPRPRGRGLCALAQTRETGETACCDHAIEHGGAASVCWAGLRELGVPILAGEENLGWFVAGGYVLAEEAEGVLDETERRLSRLGLVPDALARATHPRLAPHDVGMIEELIRLAADEVALVHGESRRATRGRTSYDAVVGPSTPMQELYRLLDKIIDSDSTVLIQGENGTGKELIAKAIHYNSPRKNRRFLIQNCSAFNDNLLDSELFGHRKGAFTGAIADKIGLFEAADGGTFFLDEIGDMSPALQVKVLRVLQEGTFMAVGDTATRRADVRIIAATNRDLKTMVTRGEFREDLYYRVNVINLVIPPLRERREDIPILIEHFLKKHGRGRRAGRRLSKECQARLVSYAFPGNVRELENEIERLVVLAGDERVIPEDLLSPRIRQAQPAAREERGLPGAIADLERMMIDEALRRHRGNKTRAALELQISRRNLIRLVQKYDLEKPRATD